MTREMNGRSIYIILTSILSVLGFIWIFVCDLSIYLQFAVSPMINVLQQREHLDNIPSIQFCYTFSDELLSEGLQKVWDSFPKQDEVLDTEKTTILGYSSGQHDVKKILKDNFICYDITLARHLIAKNNLTGTPVMARIVLKPEVLSNNKDSMMYVTLHSRDSGATTRSGGFIQSVRGLPDHPGSRLTVSYSRSIFYLLASPYITNCVMYKRTNGYSNQDDCYNRCLMYRTNVTGALPSMTIIDDPSLLSFTKQKSSSSTNDTIHCKKQCIHMDCISDVISPRLISAVPAEVDQVDIVYPIEPEIMTSYIPYYTVSGLCKDLLITLCFWMAISPIPFIIFERTVNRIVSESVGDIKRKRNGVSPQESSNGVHASNGVNIVNAFANNNINNGHA